MPSLVLNALHASLQQSHGVAIFIILIFYRRGSEALKWLSHFLPRSKIDKVRHPGSKSRYSESRAHPLTHLSYYGDRKSTAELSFDSHSTPCGMTAAEATKMCILLPQWGDITGSGFSQEEQCDELISIKQKWWVSWWGQLVEEQVCLPHAASLLLRLPEKPCVENGDPTLKFTLDW